MFRGIRGRDERDRGPERRARGRKTDSNDYLFKWGRADGGEAQGVGESDLLPGRELCSIYAWGRDMEESPVGQVVVPAVVETVPVELDGPGIPVYEWKSGSIFYLSKREKIVVDTFLKTGNYAACLRALAAEGMKAEVVTIKQWMEREHVKNYIEDKLKQKAITEGWTRERWVMMMTEHIEGRKRLQNGDLYAMKLMASVCGWETPEALNVTQINFTERQ